MSALRSFAVTIAAFAGIIAVTSSISAQPATESQYGQDSAVGSTVDVWRTQAANDNIYPERPYVICVISTAHCIGCGAAAVNQAMRKVESLSVNRLVVVATETPREGVAFRRMFKVPVVEDSPGHLTRVLGFTGVAPELVVVKQGKIVFHQKDIQHDSLEITAIKQAVNSSLTSAVIDRTSAGVSLQEDDNNMVVGASAPRVDSTYRVISFVDAVQGCLYRFDLDKGLRLGRFGIPDEINQHFRDPADTTTVWKTLIEGYSPLTRIDDIVSASGDTLELLTKMFTGYDLVPLPNGKQQALLNQAMVFLNLKIVSDSLVTLIGLKKIKESPYFPMPGTMQRIGPSLYVGCAMPERALTDTSWVSNYRDSVFTLITVCGDSLNITPMLSLAEQEKLSGPSDLQYVKYLTNFNGLLYYYDGGNGGFLMGRPECKGRFEYRPIKPGGVLSDDPAPQHSTAPVDSTVFNSLKFGGIIATANSTAHVVLTQADTIQGRDYVVIQTYRDGSFVKETIYRYALNDEIAKFVLAGYDRDEIVALAKWRNRRWTIERFPME